MKLKLPRTTKGWSALVATVAGAIAAAISEGVGYSQAVVAILRAVGLD